jgi:hypothetical protein
VRVANCFKALLDDTRFAEMRSEIARSSAVFGAHNAAVYTGQFRLASSMLQIDTTLAVGREQLAHFKTDREKLEGYVAAAHGMRLAGRLDSASVFERRRREIVLEAQQTRIAVVSVAQKAMLRAMVIGDARGAQILLDSALKALRWDTRPVLDRAYDRVIMAKVAAGDLATARQLLSAWQQDVPSARAKP